MKRAALVSSATAGTVLCSAFAIDRLVAIDLWVAPVVTTLAVMVVTLLLLRRVTRRQLVPTLGAALAAVLTIIGWYARSEALLFVLPTRGVVEESSALVRRGLDAISVTLPPINDSAGVGLLVTAGVAALFLLADVIAVPGRAPVWAMVPILSLWLLPVLLLAPVHTWAVAATGVGFLAMLTTGADAWRAPSGRASPLRMGMLAAVTAAVVCLALVAAPWVMRMPSPVRWHSPAELADADATRLDLGLNLRSDLNRPRDAAVMTYEGVRPSQLGPLHAYTLTTFDGASWDRTQPEEWEQAQGLLWPGPVAAGDALTATISINDLGQDRLPIPGEPRRVEVDLDSFYSPAADELRVVGAQPGALTYDVSFRPRELRTRDLEGLDPRNQDVDPALLQTPDTGYGPDVAALARDIVNDAGAQNPYEELVALQNYLRDPELFTYTESVTSARTRDAVWDFLHDRRGYCVQFATAMVVMARSLDLPARLAVGYLPGSIKEDGSVEITAHQAHAWPQVLFPEVGWVRFEPTPGVQAGTAPQWAPEPEPADTDPAEDPSASAETTEETSEQTSSDEETTETAGAEETGSTSANEPGASAAPAVGLALLAGLLLAALALMLVLRRRRASEGEDLAAQWRLATGLVRDAGGTLPAGATPRTVAEVGQDVLADDSARSALRALAEAVERARYTPGQERPAPAQVREWLATISAGAKESAHHRG